MPGHQRAAGRSRVKVKLGIHQSTHLNMEHAGIGVQGRQFVHGWICQLCVASGCCACAGDFSELSLTFTAAVVDSVPAPGGKGTITRQREVELKPGGRDIAVKADNVIEYIHRLADFRLNRQMDRAAAAFLRGFFELVKPRWVRMFNEAELQMLISGSEEGVDVDDLMRHVNYAGGFLSRAADCETSFVTFDVDGAVGQALQLMPVEYSRSTVIMVCSTFIIAVDCRLPAI